GIGVPMSGNLALYNSWSDLVRDETWTVYGGSWQNQHSEDLNWADCYTSAIAAHTFDQSGTQYGNSSCNPQPPPPGGGGCGGILVNRGEDCSPIVINLAP